MNKKYEYDSVMYIGRFQPAHNAHIETTIRALGMARQVIILVGSANQPRTIENPWKWYERGEMIHASLPKELRERVIILPIRDVMYNDSKWVRQVQEVVQPHINDEATNGIIGYSKDETSYYLKMFPQWKNIEVDNIDDLHATDIRIALFENEDFDKNIGINLPKGIHDYLKSFMLTLEYEQLVREYEFQKVHDRMWDMDAMLDYFLEQEIGKYGGSETDAGLIVRDVVETLRKKYRVAPYKPYFNTVDVVVVQSGHVLLVRRRSEPGKGLYAMPGGYLMHKEWTMDGALRELKEETGIKVPVPVLKGNIKDSHVFEHPNRSLRGRIITHTYGIELPAGELPKVKGGDDADKAKWVPLNVFEKMEDQMFEDHYHIIKQMLARLPEK